MVWTDIRTCNSGAITVCMDRVHSLYEFITGRIFFKIKGLVRKMSYNNKYTLYGPTFAHNNLLCP